jgi:periplasmic divalent cation tolerance protein
MTLSTVRAEYVVASTQPVRLPRTHRLPSSAMDAVVCLVTTPPDQARSIAEALVARELVACVNIVAQVASVYRWKGAVEHDEESLLVIKTTRAAVPALDAALRELHPYETFELVALDVAGGSADYLAWIGDSVAAPDA